MKLKVIPSLFVSAARNWSADQAPRMSASLAYYTLFSISPLLIIVLAITSAVFGEQASRGEVVRTLTGLIGPTGAQAIQSMLANARTPGSGALASVLGVVVLILGATGVFSEIQSALNFMWGVQTKPGRQITAVLRQRFLSFALVMAIAFLLLVSLLVATALAALGTFFSAHLPGGAALWQGVNFLISLGVTTVLFAMIFKVLPDVQLRWRQMWAGAFLTSVLFTIGKFIIGFYLGNSTLMSAYGAAGSIAVLLVWVYYSAMIFYFGAEFTRAYVTKTSSELNPKSDAVFSRSLPLAS